MKSITPLDGVRSSFMDWLEVNEERINGMINDDNIRGDQLWSFFRDERSVYNDLKAALVKNQGYICCYCGQRIESDFHTSIEHLKPKSIFKEATFALDNLLASCKGGSVLKIHIVEDGETLSEIATKHGVITEYLEDVYINIDELRVFGKIYDIENLQVGDRVVIIPILDKKEQHCDIRKGNRELPIHPFQENCSEWFEYDYLDGKILITEENISTINILGLNENRLLNQIRKKTLRNAILLKEELINDFGDDYEEFERHRNLLLEKLGSTGLENEKLEPFVFVIIWSLNN